MKTEKVYFSLGSNIGNRVKNIFSALELMERKFAAAEAAAGSPCGSGLPGKGMEPGMLNKSVSGLYETEPWGFEAEEKFINCAAMFELSLSCRRILEICKEIEREMGREVTEPQFDAAGRRIYSSRIIDIDILLYGDEKINDPDLTVPHPQMREREFVMAPLKEIMSIATK